MYFNINMYLSIRRKKNPYMYKSFMFFFFVFVIKESNACANTGMESTQR